MKTYHNFYFLALKIVLNMKKYFYTEFSLEMIPSNDEYSFDQVIFIKEHIVLTIIKKQRIIILDHV